MAFSSRSSLSLVQCGKTVNDPFMLALPFDPELHLISNVIYCQRNDFGARASGLLKNISKCQYIEN